MAKTVSLELHEGQVVWFHSEARHVESEHVRVLELDRLWAILSNGFKANRYTGVCDGSGMRSPGSIYAAKEDWERERALYASWVALQRDIAKMHEIDETITRRTLLTVRRMLKIGE